MSQVQPLQASVRVVRFANSGLRETHELAVCEPCADGSATLWFADRVVATSVEDLKLSHVVDERTYLSKASVHVAVHGQLDELRVNVPVRFHSVLMDVKEMKEKCSGTCCGLEPCCERMQSLTMRRTAPERCSSAVTEKALQDFDESAHPSCVRMQDILGTMHTYKSDISTFLPTSRVQNGFDLSDFTRVPRLTRDAVRRVTKLCKDQDIAPPSKDMREKNQNYLSFEGSQLVAYISLSVYNMNRTPGSVCVNIETAVSIDKTHRMSKAMKTIGKNLRHRKNKCVLFAQSANTEVAENFWKGRLTQTKRASMINGLLSVYNEKHKIYEDASDMAIFFE